MKKEVVDVSDRTEKLEYHGWRPHPWHGLSPGKNPPTQVRAFIEITPFDLVKYEVDKETGYIVVDRPQRTSAQPPALYGFIPRTYCADGVQALTPEAEKADGDPLDICVISERRIDRGAILIDARVIGGIQMLDGGEADDKIIAVLSNDYIWSNIEDICDLPDVLVQRLKHYFGTYKMSDDMDSEIRITGTYGPEHAGKVITAAMNDYERYFGAQRAAWERAEARVVSDVVSGD
ncbi:MAG: inorganic pyrophosphatase [Gammaproteobacteria bacterium]|nr:MAG: inorganic pyrophosphatase [Gammaproteobacteria bacterium]